MTSPPLRRDLFAVTEHFAYLNHAAVGVLPRPVGEALRRFVDAHANGGVMGTFPYEARMPHYRRRIASFIGAAESEIAVLRNTGDGANAIAGGLQWRAGDEIVLPDNEFPANVLPWLRLRKQGVVLRFVPSARERLTADVLRSYLSPRTKLVAVSWVSFDDGYRHDLASLSEAAHAGGALLAVDAIQGLGAFPLDVRSCGVDALYCGGAKWMLALQGVSFLYVEKRLMERLGVAAPGWRSVRDMWLFSSPEQPLAEDASRFEGGTPNFAGALSLGEAVAVIEQAGTKAIQRHVLSLTDRLVEGLRGAGAEIVSRRSESESSGIVTFRVPGRDPIAIGKRLQSSAIIATYRANGIRVAPHGYNVPAEIDALVEVIRQV